MGPRIDLADGLNAAALAPILTNEAFVKELGQYLPKGEAEMPPADTLRDNLQSPQFKQAVSLFSGAFSSGDLAPLIEQFDLGEGAVEAAKKGDLEAFLKALESKKAPSSERTRKSNKSPCRPTELW